LTKKEKSNLSVEQKFYQNLPKVRKKRENFGGRSWGSRMETNDCGKGRRERRGCLSASGRKREWGV